MAEGPGAADLAISLLTSVQSITRVFAPYAWGALSDHTGAARALLRFSAAVALVSSLGLWWHGGAWWLGLVLLVMFTHTSSMMSLTEAAMAHLVAGDWGRYGRIRLWGSAGFLVTVFFAGEWFEHFGMGHFPAWAGGTLAIVLIATLRLPDVREPAVAHAAAKEPVGPVLRIPAVRWFFVSLFFHVMAHFAVYGFLSLYLDSLGYGKGTIGLLWALSVVAEIAWFYPAGPAAGPVRDAALAADLRRRRGAAHGHHGGVRAVALGAGGGAGRCMRCRSRRTTRPASRWCRAISRAGCAGAGRRSSP